MIEVYTTATSTRVTGISFTTARVVHVGHNVSVSLFVLFFIPPRHNRFPWSVTVVFDCVLLRSLSGSGVSQRLLLAVKWVVFVICKRRIVVVMKLVLTTPYTPPPFPAK
jgi:hypothetical protein